MQAVRLLAEVYGTIEAGLALVKYILKRMRDAPFQLVCQWATTGILLRELRRYIRSFEEWSVIDVERQFEVSPADAVRLLTESGFHAPEPSGNHWIRRGDPD